MLRPCSATNTDVGSVSPLPLHRRTHCAHYAQISISLFSSPCRTSAPSASSAAPLLPGIAVSPPLFSGSVAAQAWACAYARQPPQTSHTPSSYASALRSSHSPNRPPRPPPSRCGTLGSPAISSSQFRQDLPHCGNRCNPPTP